MSINENITFMLALILSSLYYTMPMFRIRYIQTFHFECMKSPKRLFILRCTSSGKLVVDINGTSMVEFCKIHSRIFIVD